MTWFYVTSHRPVCKQEHRLRSVCECPSLLVSAIYLSLRPYVGHITQSKTLFIEPLARNRQRVCRQCLVKSWFDVHCLKHCECDDKRQSIVVSSVVIDLPKKVTTTTPLTEYMLNSFVIVISLSFLDLVTSMCIRTSTAYFISWPHAGILFL